MPQLGPMELIIILVIVIIVFGVGKLPEVGGALGKGIREFRNASKEIEEAKEDVKAVAESVDEGETKA
ncbi:MAG TPA: twin-arginine translocase TatA/TatE family subunit [Chloroflexi bacterium]|jgi:sec-independent protein translocase protein TatA|nr:twin-arginine translocase TatA/TatE family subunit [Chloroflexota bacterium]